MDWNRSCGTIACAISVYIERMRSSEELASQILIGIVHALCDMAIHAYKRGITRIPVPLRGKALRPLEARKYFVAMLDHRRMKAFVNDESRGHLLEPPASHGPTDSITVLNGFDRVDTDVWMAGLRPTLPSFTAATPMIWTDAYALSQMDVESWWPKVRPRPRKVIEEANRQAAAWRWRADVASYVHPMRSYPPAMRKYILQVREMVPVAARFAAKRRWFKPDRGDFPLYGDPVLVYTDNLLWSERQELVGIARARSGPLRWMLDVDGALNAGYDLSTPKAWQIMAASTSLPEHPAFPIR